MTVVVSLVSTAGCINFLLRNVFRRQMYLSYFHTSGFNKVSRIHQISSYRLIKWYTVPNLFEFKIYEVKR